MENQFIEKVDENGVKHYVNPKFENIFDGTEVPEQPTGSLATFTEEELQQAQSSTLKQNAKRYLADTDWYVTRYSETGVAIPQDILDKRAEARTQASE